MTTIDAICPHCRGRMRVPGALAGRELLCTTCLKPFAAADRRADADTIGAPGGDPAAAATQLVGGALGRVGRFELRRFVGHGGYGTVYLAHDPHLDRDVALKLPKVAPRSGAEADRFLREARAASRLKHPNIVAIYDAGRDGEAAYIAAEFVDGVPLSVRLNEGPLDRAAAVRLVRDLALALDYAHGQGVVHRDVKPANVMLAADGRPQLMDFGLASRADETAAGEGGPVGTPAYMAPEQARGEPTGPPADVYALGVVLYELVAGRRPFDGPPQVVLALAAAGTGVPPLAVADLSPDLEAVVMKALAARPDDRYRTAAALADDLARALDEKPVAARPPTAAQAAARWAADNPAAGLALLGLAAGLLVGVGPAALLAGVAAGLAFPPAVVRRATGRAGAFGVVCLGIAVVAMLRQANQMFQADTPDALTGSDAPPFGRVAGLIAAVVVFPALVYVNGPAVQAWDRNRGGHLRWWYAAVAGGAVVALLLSDLAAAGLDADALARLMLDALTDPGRPRLGGRREPSAEGWRSAATAADRLARAVVGLPVGLVLGEVLRWVFRPREPGWAAFPAVGAVAAVAAARVVAWVKAGADPADPAVPEWVWFGQTVFPAADAELARPPLDFAAAGVRVGVLVGLAAAGAVGGAGAAAAVGRVRRWPGGDTLDDLVRAMAAGRSVAWLIGRAMARFGRVAGWAAAAVAAAWVGAALRGYAADDPYELRSVRALAGVDLSTDAVAAGWVLTAVGVAFGLMAVAAAARSLLAPREEGLPNRRGTKS